MRVVVVGLNPEIAPKELWDAAFASTAEHSESLDYMVSLPGVRGASLVSGPRRLECYWVLEEGRDAFEAACAFFSRKQSAQPGDFLPYLYMGEGFDAVSHVHSVACGVDSFSRDERSDDEVGEAWRALSTRGPESNLLSSMLGSAVRLGERVWGKSGAADRSFELSTVAVDVAERVFDDFSKREILLIGGGRLGEGIVRRMLEKNAGRISVIHPARGYAEVLARALGGCAYDEGDLISRLSDADVVLVSAMPEGDIIDAKVLRKVRKARRGRMLMLIDLADGGSLDASCADVDDVLLCTLEDLGKYAGDRVSPQVPPQGEVCRLVSEASFDFSQEWGLGAF